VQKLSGEAAISLRPADRALRPPIVDVESAEQTQHSYLNSQNRETKVAHKDHREDHCSLASTTRKSSEWSALEKPVRRLPNPPPAGQFYLHLKTVLWSWRRDSNPRPSDYKSDALPAELRQQILGIAALSRKPIPLIPSACPGQL
jgi:hypothetical protein